VPSITLRIRRLRRALGALAFLAVATAAPGLAQQPDRPTTILLVRHAEAGGGDPRDPALTAAGTERAGVLADALRGAGVTAVYSTQFRRTRETGAAVAEALGTSAAVFEVSGADIPQYSRALLEHIRNNHGGETVLVVGHSNTVPAFVAEATGRPADPIDETEFDRLYVVTLTGAEARVIRARYGS
jgi:broad specificity phosphatase PhoE